MQLISKGNKVIRFLLCVIDIYIKYTKIVPLEEKRVLQLLTLCKKF